MKISNLFSYGFLITALSLNPALCFSLLTVFKEIGFSRWSLSSAVIFGAVFLWSFLTIRVRVRRSLTDSVNFLPEFCLCEEVFPSFSNAVITFQTVLLATQNNSGFFVTLESAIRALTIWPLLKSNRSAILMNFDWLPPMIFVKYIYFSKIRREKLINQKTKGANVWWF